MTEFVARHALTTADYVAFLKYLHRHRLRGQLLWRNTYLAMMSVAAFVGLLWILAHELAPALVIGTPVGLLVGALLVFAMRPKYTLTARRIVQDPTATAERTLTLESGGIRETTANYDLLLKWQGIEATAITKEHVFVHLTLATAFIIPRHLLTAEALSTVRANVPASTLREL